MSYPRTPEKSKSRSETSGRHSTLFEAVLADETTHCLETLMTFLGKVQCATCNVQRGHRRGELMLKGSCKRGSIVIIVDATVIIFQAQHVRFSVTSVMIVSGPDF
jgi:hypothetical protein